MSDLIHIVYVSFSSTEMSEDEIIELLAEVRAKNKKQHVTGLLLHNNESFIQVIEGEKNTINRLYEKIKTDPRHENIVKLLEEPIHSRAFPDWSMGFQEISSAETAAIPGFSKFMISEEPEKEIEKARPKVMDLLFKFKKYT